MRFTKAHKRQSEGIKLIREIGIILRRTPTCRHFILNQIGKRFKEALVLIKRNGFADFTPVTCGVGWASH